MTLTVIDIFRQATERGLQLKAVGNDLHVNPARRCPPEFVSVLRAHKTDLLVLLQLSFMMAYSETLQETIFLCKDEDTRASLVEAGETRGVFTHAQNCKC